MQITINLKVKWSGSDIIVAPTEPQEPVKDFTNIFYNAIQNDEELFLEPNKVYKVNKFRTVKRKGKLKIHSSSERATIYFDVPNYKVWEGGQDWQLFETDEFEFVSKNINWCLAPQLLIPNRYYPSFITVPRNPNGRVTVIIENCDTTVMGKNGGFGLGNVEGSVNENHFALINYVHSGGRLMDAKNSDPNCINHITLDNVKTDYLNPNDFNPHNMDCKIRFTNDFTGFQTEGFYGTHCAEIQEPLSFHPILGGDQFYNRGWNNRLMIIHIDRFVFWLPSTQFLMRMVDPVLGNKTDWKVNDVNSLANIGNKVLINQISRKGDKVSLVKDYWFDKNGKKIPTSSKREIRSFPNRLLDKVSNYPIELQPSDKLLINEIEYTVIKKERGNNWHIENEWRHVSKQEAQYVYSVLTLDKDLPDSLDSFEAEILHSSAECLLDGKWYDAVVVSKGNSQIDLTVNDRFKDAQILHRQNPQYHLCYNHGGNTGITLSMRNSELNGFYRQSSNGAGISKGYQMENSTILKSEFLAYNLSEKFNYPERIKNLI